VARRIDRFPRNGEVHALALIDLIYAAATDPTGWPGLLERLAKATDSEMAHFTVYDLAQHREAVEYRFGGDASSYADYDRYWAAHNVFMQAAAPTLRTGAIDVGEALVPDREVMRTAFYNEFLMPVWGVLHHAGACVFMEQSLRAFVLLARKIGKPSPSPEELALLRTLTPHLQRAVAVQQRIRGLELDRASAHAALDRLAAGVMMLDAAASLLSYNTAAKSILDANDGLAVRRDGLWAAHPPAAAALRKLIASACGETGLQPLGGWLSVPRPSHRRPFVVLVAPLRIEPRLLAQDARRAIVFITDPERTPESLEGVLPRVYGLTAAEGRVAAQLLAGASTADIAEQLEITVGTVRWTLKQVFEKVGVRSQADLVRVLLRSIAGIQNLE